MDWRDWAIIMALVAALAAFYNTRVLVEQLRKLSERLK